MALIILGPSHQHSASCGIYHKLDEPRALLKLGILGARDRPLMLCVVAVPRRDARQPWKMDDHTRPQLPAADCNARARHMCVFWDVLQANDSPKHVSS